MGLVKAVVGLLIYEIGWVLAYVVLSDWFGQFMVSVRDSGTEHTQHYLTNNYTVVMNAFNLMFAVAIVCGVIWFVLYIARREYETQAYRY